jgi:hypothetical protein
MLSRSDAKLKRGASTTEGNTDVDVDELPA